MFLRFLKENVEILGYAALLGTSLSPMYSKTQEEIPFSEKSLGKW